MITGGQKYESKQFGKNPDVFNTFGNDIIQCFYDLSKVSPEPIRHLTLEYLNVVKTKWLATLQSGYWKEKEIPNEQEVMDAAIILYSLQCLNSDVHFGGDLQKYVVSSQEDDNSGKRLSVMELFGWNPLEESIPSTVVDLCVKCHRRNPRRSTNCKHCNSEVVIITPYRLLSNSLIYSFYCNMAGIDLECSYDDFLRWLPFLRPYKSSLELPWKEFVDQCYLITHVIFTLSQWGQLRLQIQQLPHEYLFLQEHLPLMIQKKDVHLVGEFIQCLRIFGVEENNSSILDGLQFLLEEQNADGSWDNQMMDGFHVDLAYVAYHATMVAIQALIPPMFTGFGCMSESTEEIVSRWYSTEFLRCEPIPSPLPSENIENDFMKDMRLASMEDNLDLIFDSIPSILQHIQDRRLTRRYDCL
ncbi:hypothetical protein WA171_000252 [Blastocystis sp. BT1]